MNAPELVIARDKENQARTLLIVSEARVWIHAIALNRPPVRLVKLPRTARRYMRPLEYRGRPYPLARALRHFRRAARELGITDGAAAALRELDAARKGGEG